MAASFNVFGIFSINYHSFLAKRYGSGSAEHGTALDYIIGFGVNDYKTNCDAGNMSEDEFIAKYYSWAKMADSELRSHNSNARVYISVGNSLQTTSSSGEIGIASFLPRLANVCSTSSQWDFAVALSLGNGEDIGEILSGRGDVYSHVGANNLRSFWEILSSDALLYDSKRRVAIVDHLSLPDTVSDGNRAAYYAYTYYKLSDAGFDTFFYAADSNRGGLCSSSGDRAELYYSALLCGSNYAGKLSSYTKKISGAVDLKFGDHETIKLSLEQKAKDTLPESLIENKRKMSLSASELCAMGGAYDVNISSVIDEDGAKKQIINVRGNIDNAYVAMTTTGISASELISSGYVGVTLSSSQNARVALIISRAGDERTLYVGEADASPESATYYFDITSFTKDISSSDELTFSLCALSADEGGDIEITVEDMMLYGSSGNGSTSVIITVAVCVIGAALCGALIWLSIRRKRRLND